MADPVAKAVAVVGLIGGRGFGPEAREAVERAEVVVGSRRQLALVEETHCVPSGAERLVLSGALDAVLDTVEDRRSRGLPSGSDDGEALTPPRSSSSASWPS